MSLAMKLLAASGSGITRPTYVGSYISGAAGSVGTHTLTLTSLTGGIGSAPIEGDLVVVFVAYTTASTNLNVTCTGYTEIADLYLADDADVNLGVFYKLMTATPDTSATVGGVTSTAAQAITFGCIVFRGVDQVTPLDVTSTVATVASSTRPNPPSITPVTPGAIIVAVGANATGLSEANSELSASELSGFVEYYSSDTEGGSNLGFGYCNWPGGAFNPAAFSTPATDIGDSAAAVTIAIRPTS